MSTRVRLYATGSCLSICIVERGMSVCYTGETIIVVSLSRFKRRHIRWDVAATASSVPNKREKFKVGRHYEDPRDTCKYENFSSFRYFFFFSFFFLLDLWNLSKRTFVFKFAFAFEMKVQVCHVFDNRFPVLNKYSSKHSLFIFFKFMEI